MEKYLENTYYVDYHDNHSEPDKGLMKVLEKSNDALDMYLHHLPDSLSYVY